MSKKSLSDEDYRLLKVFLDCYFDWYAPKHQTTPAMTPSQFLQDVERASFANAKKGLQMAIDDYVEESANWQPDQVAIADTRFAAAGTFTLSEVRQRYSRKYLQILKRGSIRSETEYYLIKGVIDGGGIEPGATEARQLQAMLDDFERRLLK